MHKLTLSILRMWMALLSLVAFLFGWVVFAHSQKPQPVSAAGASQAPAELAPLRGLPPLPEIGQPAVELQPLQPLQQPSFSANLGASWGMPGLRARGS
jgi:hypothetical protein